MGLLHVIVLSVHLHVLVGHILVVDGALQSLFEFYQLTLVIRADLFFLELLHKLGKVAFQLENYQVEFQFIIFELVYS